MFGFDTLKFGEYLNFILWNFKIWECKIQNPKTVGGKFHTLKQSDVKSKHF